MNGKIEINRLNKVFKRADTAENFCAIEDLSLEIESGEFVSIVGTSGCGKSTLLRIIAGLETPTHGEVLCGGNTVSGTSPSRGMVFQEHTLFPWMSVRKNIVFALKSAGRFKMFGGDVDTLLETAGLTDFANSFPHQLSGGMRQRAALIRSLAVSPDVLLLDEPLGALDSFTRMVLQDEIIRLWKERGNTMLLITHDVDEAVYLSNRIIVMSPRPGRIAEIVSVPMSYPRNRGASEFAQLRTRLLKRLNFASDTQMDYYL
ncbi:MAG: ABC transporter ATP-binding protein [Defluviitaleaceae bacterium]|nr:ABC transporter ATP-binding protein [Defluviitaleaceae bacterium]MCL2262391.1 ABC transporter ATP-binding protein [Defluviitaleaceae bacterium]